MHITYESHCMWSTIVAGKMIVGPVLMLWPFGREAIIGDRYRIIAPPLTLNGGRKSIQHMIPGKSYGLFAHVFVHFTCLIINLFVCK